MQNKRIVFNYLPPATLHIPSAAFSILGSFLKENDIPSETIYWNILFDKYNEEIKSNSDLLYLLPFAWNIAKQAKDHYSLKLIENQLVQINPLKFINKENPDDYFKEKISCLKTAIKKQTENIDFNEIALWGVSSKFEQWIASVFLIKELKLLNSNIKTVIGGFGSKEDAAVFLKLFPEFDFAIWGEGEYSLANLYNLVINNTTDYSSVSHLVFRSNGEIIISDNKNTTFCDLDLQAPPLFDDYFKTLKQNNLITSNVELPIEASRGCTWNRCQFCVLNSGYKFREREVDCILNEIVHQSEVYGINKFRFLDNDVIGCDVKKFNHLLDKIIELSSENLNSYEFFGEILPYEINEEIIRKMAVAGFKNIQIGFEHTSEEMLKKMNKRTSLSNSILFIKFAHKYGIKVTGANIIRNLPDEDEINIYKAIDNLHFFRFLLGKNNNFFLDETELGIYKGSRYFNALKKENKLHEWNENISYDFMKGVFTYNESNRFNLFGFTKNMNYENAWAMFKSLNSFYSKSDIYYKIILYEGNWVYEEYMNGTKVNSLIFAPDIHLYILQFCNCEVTSLDILLLKFKKNYPQYKKDDIINALVELKEQYLVYYSDDLKNIVTVIDVY